MGSGGTGAGTGGGSTADFHSNFGGATTTRIGGSGGSGTSGMPHGGYIGGPYGSAPPGYHAVFYQGTYPTGGQMIAGYASNVGAKTGSYGGRPAPRNIAAPKQKVGSNAGGTLKF